MSGIQLLILVFLAILLANLMSYLIEDFQSDDDLSAYIAWIYGEIVFNLFTLRIFVPILLISQKQGFRHFMKSAVLELASEFKIDIGLQSSNTSRFMSATQSTATLEKTQGHKRHEEALLHYPKHGLDAPTKNEVKTQDQEDVPTQKTVPLNTVNMELQEPNDKLDLRYIKDEIETEPGMAQELLRSVSKGKGIGKGQSNFKKENVMRKKHITDVCLDNVPEEINLEQECKKEDEKITRSALASRQAFKRWRENTKQAKKIVEARGQSNFKKGKVMRQKHITDKPPEEIKQELECKEEEEKITKSTLASRQALKKWMENTKQLHARKIEEAKGQSNFKKEEVMRQKHLTDNKPEEIKQEPECKEGDEKITIC